MSNSHAIIILGMHRSGTSALTRVLNLLGMEIGQPLLPKHATNESGFWEHATIVNIHEQLLKSLNSSWDDPNLLTKNQLSSITLAKFHRSLAKTLYQNFSTSSLWGIKDPRLCRLLPFWLPLLKNTGSTLHFILMTREPLEVVDSLKKRDQLSSEKSLQLWLMHILESEHYTQHYSRVFVTYDELLNNWQATVHKIAQTLQITWLHPISIVQDSINEFLTMHLKHHHVTECKQDLSNQLYNWSQLIYQTVQQTTYSDIDISRTFAAIRTKIEKDATFLQKCSVTNTIHLIIHLEQYQFSHLSTTLNALQIQDHIHWYLSIIADFYPKEGELLATGKLRWIYLFQNESITGVIAREIAAISADWVALMKVGDTCEANLFSSCIEYITHYPHWKFIYVDENSCSNREKCLEPHFKPDFNLDLLRSTSYISHFCLIQREAIQAVGGYAHYPNWENYDLIFKIVERYGEYSIGHIPDLLYYYSEIPPKKSYGQQIIESHLQRQLIDAKVYNTTYPNIYWIEYALSHKALVSIIIATCDEQQTLQRCLISLLKITGYNHYEVIVIDNASTRPINLDFCKKLAKNKKIRLINYPQNSELTTLYNFAVKQTRGDFILFLNDDSEIVQSEWLHRLLMYNQRVEVGIVGPKILDNQRRILQAGYVLGMGTVGVAGQIHQGLATEKLGYEGRAQATQSFSAISDNCMMIKRSLYEAISGFDEENCAILFNEVDLCLKIIKIGYKIIWIPQVIVLQHGQGSVVRHRQRVIDEFYLHQEIITMYQRWLPHLSYDHAYNPRLCLNGKEWSRETTFEITWCSGQIIPILHEMPRIIAFPHDNWGSGEYRVKTPLRVLHAQGFVDYVLMPVDEAKKIPTLPELYRMQGDVLLLHNFLHTHELRLLHDCQFTNHYFKIFGQDDLAYAIPKLNPFYHKNYKDIKNRIHRAINFCDRLIVSTEPLADAYRHIGQDIHVVPNYLEFARWKDLKILCRQGRKPRVGWAGATQHLGDLQLIIPVVKTLAKEVDWIFFGMSPEELRPYVHEYYKMIPFSDYPTQLAQLAFDLAVAPLEDSAFNEAKSNLRLLEYGILGYPVVCSDIYPYQSAPVTRVKNNVQAWIDVIREKISDLDAAKQEGEQLRRWVLDNWLLENNLFRWMRALSPYTDEKYRFESPDVSTRWVFILGNCLAAVRWLENFLALQAAVAIVSITSCRVVQLSDEVKISLLWTEDIKWIKLPENEKNAEIICKKQEILRSFSLNQFVKICVLSDIPAGMGRVLWLQQHFPNAYFVHIVSDACVASLALYRQLRQENRSEPFLLQRTIRHILRSTELLMACVPKLSNFFAVEYEDLVEDQKNVLINLLNFINLSHQEVVMPAVKLLHLSEYLANISMEEKWIVNMTIAAMSDKNGHQILNI